MRLKGDVKCPECGKKLDGSIEAHEWDDQVLPESGDVGVCIGCANMVVYEEKDGEYSLRRPTDDEQTKWGNDPVMLKARAAAMMYLLATEEAGQ